MGDLVYTDRSLKTEKGEEPFNNIAVEADVANNEKVATASDFLTHIEG